MPVDVGFKYKKIFNKIKKKQSSYSNLSDNELKNQTVKFRDLLIKGRTLEDILVDAYCVVIEANKRVLGMEPYDVQIKGAIVLFFGNIAEMKTGEGKTLAATMPLYLRGLKGPGNFLVTSNEYLAWRDAETVGKVYQWLGLSISVGVNKSEFDPEIDKKTVYASDIVYTTHSALGFDYLLNNLVVDQEKKFLKGFEYTIVDEADSILLDMAQTPLVISGAPKVQSNLFKISNKFVSSLREQEDFELSEDKKSVWFTEEGIKHANDFFGIDNILIKEKKDLYRHLVLSLKANNLLKINRDYVLYKNEVILLDEMNGRKLIGTKLQGGLHQAIEAKELLETTNETKSIGTISYQNLFKKFKFLSGMTGTAKTDGQELFDTYGTAVVTIPTRKPLIRIDHDLRVYAEHKEKMLSTLEMVKEAVEEKRPVLIATGSVSKSNLYSKMLLKEHIPHSLLNASTASKEVSIIENAGKKGAVTVATSMAGRGTDIKLDEFSKNTGGLLVIGTESMNSDRIDNQLRGRAGRQGEEGESYFFSSLEDRIVVENAPDWVRKYRINREKNNFKNKQNNLGILKGNKYKKVVLKSQKRKKNQDVVSRRETLEYDDVVNVLRDRFYNTRDNIIAGEQEYLDRIIDRSFSSSIDLFSSKKSNRTHDKLSEYIYNNINYSFNIRKLSRSARYTKREVESVLIDEVYNRYQIINDKIKDPIQNEQFKKIIILKSVDKLWIDLADSFVQLKTIVKKRQWGQKQPLQEFQRETERFYKESLELLWIDITRNLLLSELFVNKDGSIDIDFP